MKPLLHCASRALSTDFASIRAIARPSGDFSRLSVCVRCRYRAASTIVCNNTQGPWRFQTQPTWPRRLLSSSPRWMEDGKSAQPIPMPPPTAEPNSRSESRVDDVEERARAIMSSFEEQKRLREEIEMRTREQHARAAAQPVAEQPPSPKTQEQLPEDTSPKSKQNHVADNIERVPDEHLPSHRERQRWNLSKRFSELMDDLLPKLAVVTQKVNTYTGTDYSGVEALRREIKEQEKLVRARRAAIDTAKQSLDAAHSQQASAQKEVVALLERKHSWSAGDLERYMSLIRSEHINDQAIRQAKESVESSEAALEEARTQLEKRERAQYHEEQIWSDTIRRNSTWVTFGLMGVNIFLLLLSLAILEPWRRRRMVREIKSALETQLETQMLAVNAAPTSVVSAVSSNSTKHDISAIEQAIDSVTDATDSDLEAAASEPQDPVVEEASATSPTESLNDHITAEPTATLVGIVDPSLGVAAPSVDIYRPKPLPSNINITKETPDETLRGKHGTWKHRVTSVAEDIVSDRIISMRRIDYTSAILQGAAAGAIITASIIGILRPN